MTLVVDASITLSWVFADERTGASRTVFDEVVDEGAIVPVLWRFEVANALQLAVRRGRIHPGDRDETLADLANIDIAVDWEGSDLAWSRCLSMADKHGLTVYDASYLELAQRRGLRLATLDLDLIKAGRAEMVPVIGS